jgi:hypothetical protein
MGRMRLNKLRLALLGSGFLLATAVPAAAQWRLFESEFDEEKKPWAEIEAKLPVAPRPENLIPFEAGGATPHRFYIDAPSLSVGEDGVVRYTVVVKTAGGATNVSFEGIRCATREQKYYAAGRSDGRWVRARDPQWRRIEYKELNRHHGVLYADFFCPERHVRMATAKQVLEALKRQGTGSW